MNNPYSKKVTLNKLQIMLTIAHTKFFTQIAKIPFRGSDHSKSRSGTAKDDGDKRK